MKRDTAKRDTIMGMTLRVDRVPVSIKFKGRKLSNLERLLLDYTRAHPDPDPPPGHVQYGDMDYCHHLTGTIEELRAYVFPKMRWELSDREKENLHLKRWLRHDKEIRRACEWLTLLIAESNSGPRPKAKR